jgi:hypothetical protein
LIVPTKMSFAMRLLVLGLALLAGISYSQAASTVRSPLWSQGRICVLLELGRYHCHD